MVEKDREVTDLRTRAEDRVMSTVKRNIARMSPEDIAELIHELETHQIELELQNEDLKNTQQELAEIRDQYIELYDFAPVGYVTVGKGLIRQANLCFVGMIGVPRSQLIAKPLSSFIDPQDQDVYYAHQRDILETLRAGSCELRLRSGPGDLLWVRMDSVCVESAGEGVGELRSTISDIAEGKKAEVVLNYQASHDDLTGLINRREFERRSERLISTFKPGRDDHALIFMDLDRFKVINDTCGHTAGDEMLRQVGRVMQSAVRHRDTLARLGGDEFGVLMEHCSLEQAHRLATSIECAISDFRFIWEGHIFRISVSIGVVALSESTTNLSLLLKNADAACYMAKDLGRNRIHLYHPEDTELSQRHGEMQWVSRINQALEDDRFCLYAQPIVALDNKPGKHLELLLRMIDENGEVIPPGAFLPAAERYDLMELLDRWVIKRAFSLLAASPEFLVQVDFVSINLSGRSLNSGAFLDFVASELKASKIQAGKICFEVTETAAILNLSAASTIISQLIELGFQFALDDFGSGLSSFGYLKFLPVKYLKIDGMFVKDIVNDTIDHAMVKSINDIGQVMGMETIAEFVENDEIKKILKQIGVNYAQGYGIGKPRPFDKLLNQAEAI